MDRSETRGDNDRRSFPLPPLFSPLPSVFLSLVFLGRILSLLCRRTPPRTDPKQSRHASSSMVDQRSQPRRHFFSSRSGGVSDHEAPCDKTLHSLNCKYCIVDRKTQELKELFGSCEQSYEHWIDISLPHGRYPLFQLLRRFSDVALPKLETLLH